MTECYLESSTEDEIPLPSQQPLEVDFIQHNMTEYCDTNGKPLSKYDVKEQRFIERRPQVSSRFQSLSATYDLTPDQMNANKLALVSTTDSFNSSIEALKKKKRKHEESGKFSILSECHDWNDVMQKLQDTTEAYEKDDSVSGKIRKAFRRVGDNSKSIQSFIEMLPDGQYKTLCGGLTLILTAMGRHSEVRQAMSQILEDLPDYAKDCEDYRAIYRGNNMLLVRVNELYIELLGALEEIVKWYTQSSGKRIVGSLLQNSNYGQNIHRRVQNIKKCRIQFLLETDKLQHYQLQMMDQTGVETNEIVHQIHQRMLSIEKSLKESKRRDSMIYETIGAAATSACNGLKDILHGQIENAEWKGQLDQIVQKLKADEERNQKVLEERMKELELKDNEIRRLKSQADTNAGLVNQLSQTPQSLAERLSLELNSSDLDVNIAQAQSTELNDSMAFQNRASWVAKTSEFANWLSSSESGTLFVQGNSELESTSSLSYLVSILYEKLDKQKGALVLPFFCGLQNHHVNGDLDEIPGPVALLRAILAQLLNRGDINWDHGNQGLPYLSFLGHENLSELEAGSFTTYLSTISRLLSAFLLTHNSIFVMLDGLDYLDAEASHETKQMIKALVKLVRNTNAKKSGTVVGSLKVLCTASSHLEYCPTSRKGVVVLNMSEDEDGSEDEFEELSTGESE